MAHLHNALHHPTQLLDALRRAVGAGSDSDFEGTSRFGETLQPVMDVWSRPEWEVLRGEVRFARKVASVGVTARFSSVELVNPTGSGVLAVVNFIRSTNGSTLFNVGVDSGGAIAANPVTNRGVATDTRYPQLGEVSRCTVTTGDVAATVALIQDTIGPPETCTTPWVIAPGKKLFIIGTAVLSIIAAALVWSERRLFDGEERG